MPVSEKKKASNKKHDMDHFEYWSVKLKKGQKAQIQAAAAAVGESLNGYIIAAIAERMKKDGYSLTSGKAESNL